MRFTPLSSPGLLAAACLVLLPVSAAGQGIAALEAAAERFATVTSMCAGFEQVLSVELLRQEVRSRGTMCQRRPGFFSMRFSDPQGDEIIADGTWFWLHMPSQSPGQVVRIPMSSQPQGLDFYREFLEDPLEKYAATEAGSETIDGVATHSVRLVPNARNYRQATVWIDPAASVVRRIRIVENNGTVRTIGLSDIRLNPALADDFFKYTPPPGTDVITMNGGAPSP